jgi:hypothetical protein
VEWEGGEAVSDTPRTDAAYAASTGAGIYELFKESQDIERELNEANKTNRLQYELITTAEKRGVDKSKEELNAANDRIKLLAHELESVGVQCGIAVTNEAIATNENHKLKQRISRLEQLGDALADAIDESCDPTHANDVTRWRRNKESKP